MKLLIILLGGALFGAGLVISGMTDPTRVIGFLDLFGNWQPALAFVMGGAVATFGLGLFILKRCSPGCCGITLPDTSADKLNMRQITGAAIFGIGWGLVGFCPGPAIANLVALRTESIVFIPAMIVGMIAVQLMFKVDN